MRNGRVNFMRRVMVRKGKKADNNKNDTYFFLLK